MAIVQISRITNRKGLQADLPQLAGAELGWSIDERRLFIGNGTLEEGAPVIGNTEILTEFSDIFALQTDYTYKGQAAGYTVQTTPSGTPITQSLQSWLDQFATVKDFGAVGDGVTDDTEAINWALYQLFCRESNPQIRRSLFFPAGVYRVTSTIFIPPYATLYGEGIDNSIIRLDDSTGDSTLNAFVARTADSLQQYGVNIGTNGATPPIAITISNMGFYNQDPTTDVFLVEDAVGCRFINVSFSGPRSESDLTSPAGDTAGVRFASSDSLITTGISFNGCLFTGTIWGISTEQEINAITVTGSKFEYLYQGVALGITTPVNAGPVGFRIINNFFDNIYAEGIVFGDVELNVSSQNIFYDVGNHFNGATSPATYVIDIQSNNNLSMNDMFQRTDAYSGTYRRINLGTTTSIGLTNTERLQFGSLISTSGQSTTLLDNQSSVVNIYTAASNMPAFTFNYKFSRGGSSRTGALSVAFNPAGSNLTYQDDYIENGSPGVTLVVAQVGTTVTIGYTSTSVGYPGTIRYSITRYTG